MLAIDDGIWRGNYDAADVLFLIAVVLAAVATLLYAVAARRTHTERSVEIVRWAPVAGWAAVVVLSVGWLVL